MTKGPAPYFGLYLLPYFPPMDLSCLFDSWIVLTFYLKGQETSGSLLLMIPSESLKVTVPLLSPTLAPDTAHL